jgi:hypothetical protein
MSISRRAFLTGMAGVAAAPIVPALPVSAAPTVELAAAPSWTMWAIGTPDEYDWRAIAAPTREDAFREYLHLQGISVDSADTAYPIDECVKRVTIWDDLGPDKVRPGDWIDADMGHSCFRCDSECYGPDGARNLDGEAVCQECLTIADIVAHDEDEDVIERLADEIADRGEDGTIEWLASEEAEVPPDLWAEAVRRAAT